MTIKELYEIALEKSAENFEIEISYRDDGGCYYGTDSDIIFEIDKEKKTIIL